MNNTRKLVYAAVCAAIAALSMIISRYFPFLSVTPLMLCSVCFFIALQCGWIFGFLSMAAALIIGFFAAGDIITTFLLAALIFAPYAVLAFLIKRLDYKAAKPAIIRIAAITIAFNALLAVLVFGLGRFMLENFIFGFDISQVLAFFGGAAAGYIIFALIATALMIGFDYIFVNCIKILNKRLKFLIKEENVTKNHKGEK